MVLFNKLSLLIHSFLSFTNFYSNIKELKNENDKLVKLVANLTTELDLLKLELDRVVKFNKEIYDNLTSIESEKLSIKMKKKRDVSNYNSNDKLIIKNNLLDEKQQKLSFSFVKRKNIFIETFNYNKTINNWQQFYDTIEDNLNLFNNITILDNFKRKKILVTGGAGFVGSHLVDSLMLDGHQVIVCDNFDTGRESNVKHWLKNKSFQLINFDIINPLTNSKIFLNENKKIDEIYHLASPASPIHYMSNPIKTIKTNSIGTINMLELAKKNNAKILIASTSEIYGDPKIHPQLETYWGNVNSIGPRSCYDESKRLSESLAIAYNSKLNVSISIARIFNTYGPRMDPNDGRVISNFITQTINNKSLTVYGDGKQTRSFQYITDLIDGLKKLMEISYDNNKINFGPVNLGNPNEMTINSLALTIKQLMPNSSSNIIYNKLPIDDPHRRRPDINKAMKYLDWKPIVNLFDGLSRTIDYFKQELGEANYFE